MIVADTSAFAAIVIGEDDARRFAEAIEREERVIVAAPTAFGLQLVRDVEDGEKSLESHILHKSPAPDGDEGDAHRMSTVLAPPRALTLVDA